MRRLVVPFLFALVGCAGGGSVAGSENPAPLPPGSPDWTDALVGDGELKGAPGAADDFGAEADSAAAKGGAASSSGGGGSSGGTSGSSGASAGAAPSESGTSSSGGWSSSSSSSGYVPPTPRPAGVLTAGTWDDNRNFTFFSAYRDSMAGTPGLLDITTAEAEAAAKAFGANATAKSALDISLVIDTTGSMGDEIAYLQSEFTAIAQTIQTKYGQAQQHWSLVLYKDTTDEYVVRWFDFRADTSEFKTKLLTASAGGGGDFPEAPDQALAVAHRLSWRRDANVARLMFWVGDAPHHDENAPTLTKAIKAARDKNIHIYPVASSGVDELTEHTMRSAAQLTGGRYIFLTDDSGVGGAHKEPTTPCYFVTKLDNAILRMVDVELTGTYREPSASEIIRTSGDPQSGVCKVGGGTVNIY